MSHELPICCQGRCRMDPTATLRTARMDHIHNQTPDLEELNAIFHEDVPKLDATFTIQDLWIRRAHSSSLSSLSNALNCGKFSFHTSIGLGCNPWTAAVIVASSHGVIA